MSRLPINSLLHLSRRSLAVAEAGQSPAAEAARRATAAALESGGAAKEEIFWMRDPKTGDWIPENRFGEVDVAELRARFLPKK